MSPWKVASSVAFAGAVALAAAGSVAAEKKVPPSQQEPAAAPSPTQSADYGVKLGGFFTDEHKEAAKKSFEKHFAKIKECPKDMERKGKTCRALVQGHYWAVGQPLRKEVETFPLPEEVQARLPKPPEGYEYVRAGEDILLVSKGGLNLVVDVMQDVVA